MGKDNMLLGYARGAVGDVVFSRVEGQQITKARNRAPANPKSYLQALNRVLLKKYSAAYSILSPICDHSFEGLSSKTKNYGRFISVNRTEDMDYITRNVNLADEDSVLTSFATQYPTKDMTLPVEHPYIISSGSLPKISINRNASGYFFTELYTADFGFITYAEVLEGLGLKVGDQLTFVFVWNHRPWTTTYGCFTAMNYARVILEPSNKRLQTNFASSSGFAVPVSPNARNEGDAYFKELGGKVYFSPRIYDDFDDIGGSTALVSAAVIVSRYENGKWRRSVTTLYYEEVENRLPLGAAVSSFMSDGNSSKYLDQADE